MYYPFIIIFATPETINNQLNLGFSALKTKNDVC